MPEDFDTSRTYEITFWAKNDTNLTQANLYKKAIADFETLYPNIKVHLSLYTDYVRIYNDVITNIATNTTPDVCITYPDHIATYRTGQNVVVELDPLMSDPQYGLGGSALAYDGPKQSEICPAFLAECKLGDAYYALPFMRSTEACYVNKTYVEALGFTLPEVLTWDFIWEVSEAATEKDGDGNYRINGQKVMIPFIYKSTDNMMIQYLHQKNAGYADENGEIGIFNDVTKDFLYEIASHTKTGAFSTFKISSYPANFLNAGQCIFAIDSTAGATWMGSNAPLLDIAEDKLVDFETEVMMLPQVDPDHPSMISQGPSLCLFNKGDSQQVLASWLFAQYLLTNDIQIAYSQTEGYVPVTQKARDTEEYQAYLSAIGSDGDLHYEVKILASQLLIAHENDTFTTPVFNGSATLRDAAGQMIENVTKSTRRKETVDDAYMENLKKEMTSLYHLDNTSASTSGRSDLGPLPPAAVALLVSLVSVWALILLYLLWLLQKKKKEQKR